MADDLGAASDVSDVSDGRGGPVTRGSALSMTNAAATSQSTPTTPPPPAGDTVDVVLTGVGHAASGASTPMPPTPVRLAALARMAERRRASAEEANGRTLRSRVVPARNVPLSSGLLFRPEPKRNAGISSSATSRLAQVAPTLSAPQTGSKAEGNRSDGHTSADCCATQQRAHAGESREPRRPVARTTMMAMQRWWAMMTHPQRRLTGPPRSCNNCKRSLTEQ